MSTAEHLTRTREAMASAGVDLLVLGREANARYVSGANRLWLAGTRPFSPGCVVVGATGAVHVLNGTDEGMPDGFPTARLYPISWNPANLAAGVSGAAAGVEVRRVGVDGMSPLFAALLGGAFPDAELVDGEALLRSVRRRKSAADVRAIRAALAVTEAGVDAMGAAGGGRGATELAGIFEERVGALGVTAPAFAPVVAVRGDRVLARVGVLRDGWAGPLARTWPDGDAARVAVAAGVDACVPGATVADVEARGVRVSGIGLGDEAFRAQDRLEPDLVLDVAARADDGWWSEPVRVGDGGPEVLRGG